jgi:hypothetical protein
MDNKLTRRALLRTLAGGALATTGTVVLARSALAEVPGTPAEGIIPPNVDVQARAAGVELGDLGPAGDAYAQGVFLNTGVPVFANGPFLNGGFGNGGFRNGGWRNGGFRNGGFRNGGFRNGGGGGFRNAFRNAR